MNIRLNYLYRDAGNFKNWGDVVFSNPRNLSPEDVEKMVTDALRGDIYFVATRVGVADLHFPDYNYDLDHGWHEVSEIETTTDELTEAELRTIDQFVETLRSTPLV